MRDYQLWHDAYTDPASTLSWRLDVVRTVLRAALQTTLAEQGSPARVLSVCAGDGRDVLGVLAERDDGAGHAVTLVELDPAIAASARGSAARAGLTGVRVREADAGDSDAYRGAVPADLVVMVGVLGNIGYDDLRRTIAATPQLCAPGATLVWSRGRSLASDAMAPGSGTDTAGTLPQGVDPRLLADLNDDVRTWFTDAGFTEQGYETLDRGSRPAVGWARYDGPGEELVEHTRLFTFWR